MKTHKANTDLPDERDESVTTCSENITRLLNEAKLTLTELSKLTNIPYPTLQALKTSKGKKNPTISTLLPIAKLFNISLDTLVGNSPFPPEYVFGETNLTHANKSTLNFFNSEELTNICYDEFQSLLDAESNNKLSTVAFFDSKNFFAVQCGDVLSQNFTKSGNFLIKSDSVVILSRNMKPKNRDLVLISTSNTGSLLWKYYITDGIRSYIQDINTDLPGNYELNDYFLTGIVVHTIVKKL